jgi:hypothetical protein
VFIELHEVTDFGVNIDLAQNCTESNQGKVRIGGNECYYL